MGIYFGTDGIRGVVNEFLTYEIAFKCGNALASTKKHAKIIIGGDTRSSRDYLISALTSGAISAGGKVIDIGICTTPGIAYITKNSDADFGIVISASHNPPQFNGIKIFDSNGIKLSEEKEDELERKFVKTKFESINFGNYRQEKKLTRLYEDYLVSTCNVSLKSLKIIVDASNGGGFQIAPRVFRKLGAKVTAIHCKNLGDKINENCGSTHPEDLARTVKARKADIGFAYDGDADRLIACDEKGNIVDGDSILYILAKYLFNQNKLNSNTIVATVQTNKGIEEELNSIGINVIRTNVGDKYVIEKMNEIGLNLGGEKSGHIILKDNASTGDGILASIKLAEILVQTKKKLSALTLKKMYPQCEIDCIVSNKSFILSHPLLLEKINSVKNTLESQGRLVIRASGTEPKIRIMVETKDKRLAKKYAKELAKIVMKLEEENLKNHGE